MSFWAAGRGYLDKAHCARAQSSCTQRWFPTVQFHGILAPQSISSIKQSATRLQTAIERNDIYGRQLSGPKKIGTQRVEPTTVETKREFLAALAQTGNVKLSCKRAGVSRSAAYHWRLTDPEVASAWDLALRVSMDGLREEVVETARTMGLGRWVELLDEDGQPVLNDDFEKVLQYDVSHVDARVLIKLLDKALPSADGAAKTSITVQNDTHVHATPKPMPKLVRPSMTFDVVDAELVPEIDEDTINV